MTEPSVKGTLSADIHLLGDFLGQVIRRLAGDPLSFIQLVLLKRLRSGGEPRAELLSAVLESIAGIAAGLKNTG